LLAHDEQVKLLLSRRADVKARRSFEWAARLGFPEVIDRILGQPQVDLDDILLHHAGKMIHCATAHQQWGIVRQILDLDSVFVTRFSMNAYLNNIMCSAARHGRNDLVTEVLDLGDQKFSKRQFPLSEAAAGGHLSTCELLLERNVRPELEELVERGEVLARSVARGGSVEVCGLLRGHNFWKP
jgi:ankyrin repeat protein